MTPREAVAKAAHLLDQLKPNWFELVKPNRICMQSTSYCVCGQAKLDWQAMPDLKVEYETGRPADAFYPFASPEAKKFWVEEIETRLAKHA